VNPGELVPLKLLICGFHEIAPRPPNLKWR